MGLSYLFYDNSSFWISEAFFLVLMIKTVLGVIWSSKVGMQFGLEIIKFFLSIYMLFMYQDKYMSFILPTISQTANPEFGDQWILFLKLSFSLFY